MPLSRYIEMMVINERTALMAISTDAKTGRPTLIRPTAAADGR